MRWTAVVLACLLVLSGCISGGGDEVADETSQPQSINASSSSNTSAQNASSNATYLKNSDYNQTHVHDYWPGNATTKILMNDVVQVYPSPESDGSIGSAWFSLPNGSFVPQGTGLLTVEVDATGAHENGQQAIEYKPANSGEYIATDGQGAEATWEIEVTPKMTDLPHAKSTDWAFMLDAKGAGSIMNGEANVKITAEKLRDLDAWPEHPDFWDGGNKTKLGLGEINGTFNEVDHGIGIYLGDLYNTQQDEKIYPMPEGQIVPPETKVLLINFWFARNNDPKNTVNGDVDLLVKYGSSASWYDNIDWQYMVKSEPGHKVYAIPVDGSSWDSPYAEESAWAFQVSVPSGIDDAPAGDGLEVGLTETGAGNATIDLDAYRKVPPWLSQAMEGDEDDDRSADRR